MNQGSESGTDLYNRSAVADLEKHTHQPESNSPH